MTVGQALERAEELRPGSRVSVHTRQEWLREADGMLRERFSRPVIRMLLTPWERTGPGTMACRTRMCCWPRPL